MLVSIDIFNIFHRNSLLLLLNDLKVVVYKGVVREKPANEKEAYEFIKGLS